MLLCVLLHSHINLTGEKFISFIITNNLTTNATNLCSNCTESYQVATVDEMADGTQFDIFKQFLNKPQIAAMTVI